MTLATIAARALVTRALVTLAPVTLTPMLLVVGTAQAVPPAAPTCGGLPATVVGTPGDDTTVGGRDNRDLPTAVPDVVDFSRAVRGVHVDLAVGEARGQGRDVLSVQRWYVIGSRYGDEVIGGRFADTVWGGRGPDRIAGGPGNDSLAGDATPAADFLGGDRAVDVLIGQRGNDHLVTVGGTDQLYGGPGNDELSDWGLSPDLLQGGPGDDTITDRLVPRDGQVLRGGAGRNSVDLRGGFTLDGVEQRVSGVMDLRLGTTTIEWDPPVVVETSGFTVVRLPEGPWTIHGTDASEYFWESLQGPRTIHAGGGDDYLGGSDDADHLDGGVGYDRALPERGRDTCVGVEEIVAGVCENSEPGA